MPLQFVGTLAGKKLGEYQGKKRCHLQFIENKPDGSIGFMEIKLPDNSEHSQYESGKQYTLPVEYSVVQGDVYWRLATTTTGTVGTPSKP